MTPTWLATLRASFTRLTNVRTPFSSPFDMTSLGFPAALASQFSPSAFPQVNISGLSVGGDGTGGILGDTSVQRVGTNSWAFQGSTTKIKGAHELKAGFDYRVIQLNALQVGSGSPGFNFSQAFTQGPNPTQSSTTAGYGLATFLLGIPSGSAQPPPAMAQTCKYYALFLQDSFKVTPRLTLNYGVRWEYETPRTDRFNQLTNFDYGAVPPLKAPGLNLHGALDFVGVNGVSRYASDPHPHNFAPRLGVAYHLNGKTVIRTGGGLFYASDTGVGIGVTAFGMSGFSNSTSIVTSLDGVTPMTFLDNPFPAGLVKPSGSSLGPATLLGQAVSFFDRHNRKPYSGQWSFTIQREMVKNTLLEVGYTGSRGIGFPANLGGLNQLPDTYLALGDALRTQVPNPFFGQISAGILSSATVSRAQLLRPYPQFDGVTSASAGIANSTYHSLIAKFEKRFSRGFSFLGSYTYSKNIDLNIGQFGGENVTAGGVQDYNNLRNEYSPSATDQTHRFIANAVYELPFLRSQKSFAGRLFGGWQASGILSAYSGSPLGITQSANNTFSQGGGQRPNWSGHSAALSNPTVNRWFDTSQFTAAAPYQFGNVARTLGGLRSQGVKGLDFTLSKATVIHEQFRLQFRAEIFNLTNTPIFGIPNTSLGAAAFGTINSQNNQPRIIQFALKFLF